MADTGNMPWHGVREVAFSDLPPDMQGLIWQLVEDHVPEPVIPEMLPLGTVPVRGLPDVRLSASDRGERHALDMDLSDVPPILIANGSLLDGRHRLFAARARRVDELLALDLTGIVPEEALSLNSIGPAPGFLPFSEEDFRSGTPPAP